MKYFKQTERYPSLEQAIEDLKQLFPEFSKFLHDTYKSNENKPGKCVTLIWSSSTKITKLINFTLIVDAL